jgi:GNAT superfamily N-acetyltransferase
VRTCYNLERARDGSQLRLGEASRKVLEAEAASEIVGHATYTREFSTWWAWDFVYLDCLYIRDVRRGAGSVNEWRKSFAFFGRWAEMISEVNQTNEHVSTAEQSAPRKSFTVRRAETDDARGIRACLLAAFDDYRDQYTVEAFADTVPDEDSLEDRRRTMWVYVAVSDNGEIIGTLAAALTDEAKAHLRGMAVLPLFQKRGVAKKLLAIVLDDLRAGGCKRVTLDTTAPLSQAMHFYEANGCQRTGRVSDLFGMELYEYARNLEP